MKVLHLLAAGGAGGIETLCKDYAKYSNNENIFMFIWHGGCTTDEMKANNKEVIELNASKKDIINPLRKILQLCKEKKIDAILVHHASPVMHIYAMIVKMFHKNIKVMVYAHGNAVDMCRINIKKGLILRKFVMTRSLKKADLVIAISQSVKDSLVNYFKVIETKIEIVYNGVDIERFTIERTDVDNIPQLIYVGRLIAEKGVQNTINALALIDSSIDYSFQIVGDGKYKSNLENLVKELNLNNKITFCGMRRDIPELFNHSDIYIHIPNWEEGFGITIVEAMASGNICICAKSGAIPEIIRNGENGYLVDRGDDQILAQKIEQILKEYNNDAHRIMRECAKESASKFSSDMFARNLDETIYKLCSR